MVSLILTLNSFTLCSGISLLIWSIQLFAWNEAKRNKAKNLHFEKKYITQTLLETEKMSLIRDCQLHTLQYIIYMFF